VPSYVENLKKRIMTNTVLIVDDLPDNIFLLKEVVQIIGFQAESRRNGQEAIEALQQNDYKLVFMDLEMPVKNGFEATEEIRTRFSEPLRSIPVFAISAHAKYFFEEKVSLAHFTDYIAKPYTLDKIRTILGKHNLLP